LTRVVHVRKEKFDYYIGRKWAEFHETAFGNPFHLGNLVTREECLLKFTEYWYAPKQKLLRDLAVKTFTNKVIACWCKPLLCHGDIIAGYVNWKNSEQPTQGGLF
jgi:hypothetical protein